jgi:hypothetical protein
MEMRNDNWLFSRVIQFLESFFGPVLRVSCNFVEKHASKLAGGARRAAMAA